MLSPTCADCLIRVPRGVEWPNWTPHSDDRTWLHAHSKELHLRIYAESPRLMILTSTQARRVGPASDDGYYRWLFSLVDVLNGLPDVERHLLPGPVHPMMVWIGPQWMDCAMRRMKQRPADVLRVLTGLDPVARQMVLSGSDEALQKLMGGA